MIFTVLVIFFYLNLCILFKFLMKKKIKMKVVFALKKSCKNAFFIIFICNFKCQ